MIWKMEKWRFSKIRHYMKSINLNQIIKNLLHWMTLALQSLASVWQAHGGRTVCWKFISITSPFMVLKLISYSTLWNRCLKLVLNWNSSQYFIDPDEKTYIQKTIFTIFDVITKSVGWWYNDQIDKSNETLPSSEEIIQ